MIEAEQNIRFNCLQLVTANWSGLGAAEVIEIADYLARFALHGDVPELAEPEESKESATEKDASKQGPSIIEYALICALIAVAAVGALAGVGVIQ